MKKRTKLISLFVCMMMMLAMLSPMALAADAPAVGTRTGSVDIEITPEQLEIMPFAVNGSRYMTFGTMNAFFNPGQTYTESGLGIFMNDDASIPVSAVVTSVVVTSTRTAVSGVTYYVDVGWVNANNMIVWAEAKIWNSSVSFTDFNGRDPYATWCFAFIATRVIPNPSLDFGAGATMGNIKLTVNYSY